MDCENPGTALYDWQRDCLDAWLGNHGRGIVNVATGAGKTILALAAIRALLREQGFPAEPAHGHVFSPTASSPVLSRHPSPPLTVKIIVPKVFLLAQWRRAIAKELGIGRRHIGVYRSGAPRKPIMLYVVNSARYTVSGHILRDLRDGNSVLLICDECHHMGSAENAKIFDFIPHLTKSLPPFYSLGLSATPESPGFPTVLVPALGREIYHYTMEHALRDGIIARFVMANIALRFHDDESAAYGNLTESLRRNLQKLKKQVPLLNILQGPPFYEALHRLSQSKKGEASSLAAMVMGILYKRKELVYLAAARIDCVLALIKRLSRSKILLFGERIDVTDLLYRRLDADYPGRVRRYHSGMSDGAKRAALEHYEQSDCGIMVSCKAFDEGLNIPNTDVGILLSSTGSDRQRIQRLGRVVRALANEAVKTVYYLYIEDSSEETQLLPFAAGQNIVPLYLTYDNKTKEFHSPTYDALSQSLLSSPSIQQRTEEQRKEILRNLKLGAIRADYLLPPEEKGWRLNAATTTAERNYWIVMRSIGN